MDKYITDERTGLKYELVGDYYFIAGDEEQEERPFGIWGQRYLRYIREHRKALYTELILDGKLNGYLVDLNEQAEKMFFRLVEEFAQKDGITETLKSTDQMEWVRQMNAVRKAAEEIVNAEYIYS